MLTHWKAKELLFRPGSPPVIVSEVERYPLHGPPITGEEVMRLLRSMASSRQVRELRACGKVLFVYTLPDRSLFLVCARLEDENVVFEVS